MKYIIVPGWGNSGAEHWQTYFESKLDAVRIEQNDWEQPTKVEWVAGLKQTLDTIDSDYILVAHSLGCITVLHYLEEHSSPLLKGLLLVAPADSEQVKTELDLSSFNTIPIHPLPVKTLVVASSNDEWMTVERAVHFAYKWDAELLILDNAGHISSASGFGEWEEGIEILQDFF